MKIIIGVHHFPPTYTAGAEQEAYRMAQNLRQRGHDIRVICVERIDRPSPDGLLWQDDVYHDIPVRRLFFNLADAPDMFRWSYDNQWVAQHLNRYLMEQKPDLFHLISGYLLSGSTIPVAQNHHLPVVVSLMDFWFLCPRITMLRSNGDISAFPIKATVCARCLGEERRRFRWLDQNLPGVMNHYWQRQTERTHQVEERQAFLRQALNQANVIICRSHFFQRVFAEAGIQAEKLTFSRQGFDGPQMDGSLLQKTPAQQLRVGYFGQIAPHKGVDVLFAAATQLSSLPLTVQAYGNSTAFPAYTRQLQAMCQQDKRLSLAGLYQADEVSQVLQNIDVLVVPSLWYENSPNVIVEAFAHRTPVIVSDLGGMAELVTDGQDGLRFKVGDAAALAHQLRRLIEEPALLSQLKAGIKPVKTVTQEIDELEAIYQRVVL